MILNDHLNLEIIFELKIAVRIHEDSEAMRMIRAYKLDEASVKKINYGWISAAT